jgi:hypothetical protein
VLLTIKTKTLTLTSSIITKSQRSSSLVITYVLPTSSSYGLQVNNKEHRMFRSVIETDKRRNMKSSISNIFSKAQSYINEI